MLAIDAVWNDFESKMKWEDRRSQLVSTVLMPHHGSASGRNYNPQLIHKHRPLALFSAGAFSPYPDPHPAATVVSDVLGYGCSVVNVTEYVRPGVFELVKANC